MGGTNLRTAVLLDRHPLWLDAIEKVVTGLGIEVVGRATDGDEALLLIESVRPDVFVAGIDTGNHDEVACIRRAIRIHPSIRAVVIAEDDEGQAVAATFDAGAAGVLRQDGGAGGPGIGDPAGARPVVLSRD